jgi:phosphatidylinositol glycan class K
MLDEITQLLAQDLADAIAQMDEKKRFNELLLFVDTCEASTMWKRVYSPRVMGMGSSIQGEILHGRS